MIPVPLIVLTGAAWALILHDAISMSESMGSAGRGALDGDMVGAEFTLGGLGVFLAGWTVMMGAMMLPSAGLVVYVFLHAGKDVVHHFGWFQNGAWARLALGSRLPLRGCINSRPSSGSVSTVAARPWPF